MEWKKCYNSNKYEISKCGVIRIIKTGKIMKLRKLDGYLSLTLNENGKIKRWGVHRLLMMTFSYKKNCENLVVNHINRVRDDNRLENLEWVTKKENVTGNKTISHLLIEQNKGLPVMQFNLNGELINIFWSCESAFKATSVQQTKIRACARGLRKTAGGFVWFPLEDCEHREVVIPKRAGTNIPKRINQINPENNEIVAVYESFAEMERITGINQHSVRAVANGSKIRKRAGGFKWSYNND